MTTEQTFVNIEAHIASRKLDIVALRLKGGILEEERESQIAELRLDIERKEELLQGILRRWKKEGTLLQIIN